MEILEIYDNNQKRKISTEILEALPDWFGIPEATREYIDKSSNLSFFCATDGTKALGFISIKENSKYAAEIYVTGVLPKYHKQGIGWALFNTSIKWAKEQGYEFMQVKTLDESNPDIHYAITRNFYLSVGFKPLECIPELWGKNNPCLIMIQYIK